LPNFFAQLLRRIIFTARKRRRGEVGRSVLSLIRRCAQLLFSSSFGLKNKNPDRRRLPRRKKLMTPTTRRKLAKLLLNFSDQAHQLGDDFPHAWLDGFLNVIGNYETNSDDDNSYDPIEEPAYSNYKKGATAAMILLKCPAANATRNPTIG
jgi:hypothetical protein